jgi:hypothetical protein
MNERGIYDISLHEVTFLQDGTEILRVPGGWIYRHFRLDANAMTSVFVPFSDKAVVDGTINSLKG